MCIKVQCKLIKIKKNRQYLAYARHWIWYSSRCIPISVTPNFISVTDCSTLEPGGRGQDAVLWPLWPRLSHLLRRTRGGKFVLCSEKGIFWLVSYIRYPIGCIIGFPASGRIFCCVSGIRSYINVNVNGYPVSGCPPSRISGHELNLLLGGLWVQLGFVIGIMHIV